jgi:5-formyltetrahydrofolate cyclo-ligase
MKAGLRREMIARRDAMPEEQRLRMARLMVENLAQLPEYRAAASVLATMAIGSEWNTRVFIDRARADGKAIVLPRISKQPPRHLEIYVVRDLEHDLVPGVWNIPEPDPARCRRVEFTDVDFALVPALAADRQGYRLGYGAGYFDGLLAGRKAIPFCATALPAAFLVDSLPHESHDVPVDLVLDENGRAFSRLVPRASSLHS